MTLVLVGKTGFYNFQNMDDAEFWMDAHLDGSEEVTIIPEIAEAANFIDYLEKKAPIMLEEI